jgi:hypothetical protein
MSEGAGPGIQYESEQEEFEKRLNSIKQHLDGVDTVEPREAYSRLWKVFNEGYFSSTKGASNRDAVKATIDNAGCWKEVWQTAQGSEYYVLPSGIAIRWKNGQDIDGMSAGVREPTVPVCYITEKSAKAISEALHKDNFSMVYNDDPNRYRSKRIFVDKNDFIFDRADGKTRMTFRGASTTPTLGMAPFEFQSPLALGQSIVTTTAIDNGVQLDIQHPLNRSGSTNYMMPYHFGTELTSIRKLKEDTLQK